MPEPRKFVEQIASALPPGRALDLACGSGRNAVWLAGRGWRVTAVDSSTEKLEVLRMAAPEVGIYLADLEQHQFTIAEGTWDLIVMSYYLQRDLFLPVLRGLAPGGVAIAIVHMFEPGHESSRFSVRPGELRGLFPGADALAYRESKGGLGERAIAQIAVRRKSV